MKNGDFSALLPTTVIYDPNSINAAGQRTPFPGNIIPASDFSKAGQAILGLFPDPNLPGGMGLTVGYVGSNLRAHISTPVQCQPADAFGTLQSNNRP